MRDDLYCRNTDISRCWYREICDNVDTEQCSPYCRRYTQTDYLFQLSNLPESCWSSRRMDITFLSEDVSKTLLMILQDCEFFVKSGYNLYLYGESGCGKTSWAIKILNNYFAAVAETNDFTVRGLYINISAFLADAKLHMAYKSDNYYELLQTIKRCDLVVWDDVGQTDPTNYESQLLYSLINDRMLARKSNIFTSNLSPEQLERLDKRLESRICKGADCLHITGEDMRSKHTYKSFIEELENDGTDSDN